MSTQTAAEAKAEQIKKMGQQLGSLYHALWQEVVWVNSKWNEYLELYGTKESRVVLLNRAAPFFFRVTQDALWENVLLHIARLTDPPQTRGKNNLSINRLPLCIEHIDTKRRVGSLIAEALVASEFCRDWRNRQIAHRDLALALEHGADPLKPASRMQVRAALDGIGEVMNAVSLHYFDSTTAFDIGSATAGARHLLYLVNDGLDAERKRRERLASGNFDPSDLGPRDL